MYNVVRLRFHVPHVDCPPRQEHRVLNPSAMTLYGRENSLLVVRAILLARRNSEDCNRAESIA